MSNDDTRADAVVRRVDESTVRVRYETTECSYASQFVVNAGKEEVVVNFSPGYIQDPSGEGAVLPIHSRIALSPAGASRLISTLSQALESIRNGDGAATQTVVGQAGLPKLN